MLYHNRSHADGRARAMKAVRVVLALLAIALAAAAWFVAANAPSAAPPRDPSLEAAAALDESSSREDIDVVRAALDAYEAELSAEGASLDEVQAAKDRLFWLGLVADVRADPETALAAAEAKAASGRAAAAAATTREELGVAHARLAHAAGILKAISIHEPESVDEARLDALRAQVETDLAAVEAARGA